MIMNAKNGFVQLENAVMHYASFGSGSRCMILLPGLSDGLSTVKGKAIFLAGPYKMFFKQYTVYMFSRKEPLSEGTSIVDMAKDQVTAMRQLGIQEAYLVGVSEGGMIAQAIAASYPEMIRKLVIAVSAPAVNDRIKSAVKQWMKFALARQHRELMIDTAEKSYSEQYLKKYRKLYPLLGLIGKPKNYDRFMVNAKAILELDLRADIKTITCPTLIIGGEEDKIIGVDASYEMHESIKQSQLHIYPGLGHAAYEEAPDFNERIFQFFEEDE